MAEELTEGSAKQKQFTLRLAPADVVRLEAIYEARKERDPFLSLADLLRQWVLRGMSDAERRT